MAYGSARTPVQVKVKSVMADPLLPRRDLGAPFDRFEEGPQRGAGLGSAVEAGPQHPHPPDELVTDVDRHQVALGPALGAAQQQRLHVGFEERGEPQWLPSTVCQVSGSSSLSVAPAGLG